MFNFNKLFLNLVGLIIVITVSYAFYAQSTSHAEVLKEMKKEQKYEIEKLNKDFNIEKDLMEQIIFDREGRVQELTNEIIKFRDTLKINEQVNTIWNTLQSAEDYTITAYDLSYQSCGKKFTDRSYGITRSGYSLKGQDLRTASTISTDISKIPLGTVVYLFFNNSNMHKYNGLYISQDTGSAIKGNKIDLFFGDKNSLEPSKDALNFGIQSAKVVIIE